MHFDIPPESWWGPRGFREEIHELDARVGGTPGMT